MTRPLIVPERLLQQVEAEGIDTRGMVSAIGGLPLRLAGTEYYGTPNPDGGWNTTKIRATR